MLYGFGCKQNDGSFFGRKVVFSQSLLTAFLCGSNELVGINHGYYVYRLDGQEMLIAELTDHFLRRLHYWLVRYLLETFFPGTVNEHDLAAWLCGERLTPELGSQLMAWKEIKDPEVPTDQSAAAWALTDLLDLDRACGVNCAVKAFVVEDQRPTEYHTPVLSTPHQQAFEAKLMELVEESIQRHRAQSR